MNSVIKHGLQNMEGTRLLSKRQKRTTINWIRKRQVEGVINKLNKLDL